MQELEDAVFSVYSPWNSGEGPFFFRRDDAAGTWVIDVIRGARTVADPALAISVFADWDAAQLANRLTPHLLAHEEAAASAIRGSAAR